MTQNPKKTHLKNLAVLNPQSRAGSVSKSRRETMIAFQMEETQHSAEWEQQRPRTGGSSRLTMLSNMLRSYSSVNFFGASRPGSTTRDSVDSTMGEISRLQRLLAELPNISNVTLPSRLSDLLVPRKTLEEIEANLNASPGAESLEEIEAIWRASEMVRLHDFVREMALKKLETDTFRKLMITYSTHVAQMKTFDDGNLPAFSPFGWTLQDFLERRFERSVNWIDLLLQRSEHDLEMLKFKCDMEELFKLLKLVFKGLKPTLSQTVRNEIFNFVHDAQEFLKFPQAFKVDAKKNMERLREQVNTYLDMWFYKRGPEEENYKVNLEQKLMSLGVIGPIELRYEVGWMHTKTDQNIMRITNGIEELEKQAENLRAEESKESYCARCALDMYYLDIEKFKRRISALSAQYENEFDKAENEIAYKKISMDKIRAQRKFLEEEMLRFHNEIEEMRQKEREEQEAEERRKEEEAQRLLEEELAKKKKGKKGKKQ